MPHAIRIGLFSLATALLSCAHSNHEPKVQAPATVPLATPAAGNVQIAGLGKFTKVRGLLSLKTEGSDVVITGEVRGLTRNAAHGFHIHEFGDCSAADGMSAGPHFNPLNQPHGGPGHPPHHVGDLGNLQADAKGVAKVEVRVVGFPLSGLAGRGVIVHQDLDDMKSQPAGAAGPRIGCGVIGLSSGQVK